MNKKKERALALFMQFFVNQLSQHGKLWMKKKIILLLLQNKGKVFTKKKERKMTKRRV